MALHPLLFFGIGASITGVLSAMMQPLYYAVSAILVLFHHLLSPLFGADSGWSWTLAIIGLTVFIRVLLIPLFVKQINSARNMQLLQPRIKALQDKYGSDKQRLGEETMKLYREENVNPAESCLPLLLQLPIFWALYRVLAGAATGVARGHFFTHDRALVSSLQNARIFGARLAGTFLPMRGFGSTQTLALVLILGMTAVLFVQQLQMMRKNMPPEALTGPMAQQQKMMLYLFPALYMFMGVSIPIGVLLYWFTSNFWTMGQQWILIHNNPAPNTPAWVDWEERMRAKGLDPEKVEAERRAKRSRTIKQTTVVAADAAGNPTVARQSGISRDTVRRDADGAKQVVQRQRQQPQRQTRQQRKKS